MLVMFALTMGAIAWSRSGASVPDLPKPAIDLPPAKPGEMRTAVFAGGCFWCTEAICAPLNGVTDVVSGYAGDTKANADYDKVSTGATKHAEAIKVTYDPSVISYGELLRVLLTLTDPTAKDYQGPDHGHQYRSAVFYENEDQKKVAEAYIKQLTEAKVFDKPIVTTVEPLVEFFPAEAYHQDFVEQNPNHPYVRQWALPKLKKLQEKFPGDVKPQPK